MELFEPSLPDLRDGLPDHWQGKNQGELAILLQAFGEQVDALAAAAEGIYNDQSLSTAGDWALRNEWALLYGAQFEQLPPTIAGLRTYLQARAADNGSTAALVIALRAILDADPANDSGTSLVFDAGGAGLTFPADGSGLALYEASSDVTAPTFPSDGSGLAFPGDGTGIFFPSAGRLEVIEGLTDFTVRVYVRSFLSFDRGAFLRAVQRARPAHYAPSLVIETHAPYPGP